MNDCVINKSILKILLIFLLPIIILASLCVIPYIVLLYDGNFSSSLLIVVFVCLTLISIILCGGYIIYCYKMASLELKCIKKCNGKSINFNGYMYCYTYKDVEDNNKVKQINTNFTIDSQK